MRRCQHGGARGEPYLPGCGRPRSQPCLQCSLLIGGIRHHGTLGSCPAKHTTMSADAEADLGSPDSGSGAATLEDVSLSCEVHLNPCSYEASHELKTHIIHVLLRE